MKDEKPHRRSAAEAELAREILAGRAFTLEEAIARMAGPGAMKGESPVGRLEQSKFAIEAWLESHVVDAGGTLRPALQRYVHESELLLSGYERPLEVITACCRQLLGSDYLLGELVRNADADWGRLMGERPHFEHQGSSIHPDDPYTVASVRKTLQRLVEESSGER